MLTEKEAKDLIADYVTVTIRLPKEVAEWFSVYTPNLEKRLEAELVEVCWAQIGNADPKVLMEKFCLEHVFREYGLIHE